MFSDPTLQVSGGAEKLTLIKQGKSLLELYITQEPANAAQNQDQLTFPLL